MGRPPVGKRAMTDAERQQRRRKRLQKERAAADRKIKIALERQKNREKYIPTPPDITYWHSVTVETTNGPRKIFAPRTRPLAACESDLEDDDVLALLVQLEAIARRRGLEERRRTFALPA